MMHVLGNNENNDSQDLPCVKDTCPGIKLKFNKIFAFDWCPEHRSGAKAFLMHMSECPWFSNAYGSWW